ncbi:hypothetical protein GGI17_005567, partial [Coemansia sp. S146]
LRVPTNQDLAIGDSSSSSGDENVKPLKNVANVLNSPTPSAPKNRGRGGSAIVARKLAPRTLAPRTRGISKPRAQARSAASSVRRTPITSNLGPSGDATNLSGGVAEGGPRRVVTRSISSASASSRRPREAEPETVTGRRLKRGKPSSEMDVDST